MRSGQTLAKYLEDIQWAVRPVTLVNDHAGQPLLPVELRAITLTELKEAVNAMKANKVPGMDGHPVEFWKAVIKDTASDGAIWLLFLCNLAWEGSTVPDAWHLQHVAMLYKKGDPADCGNYRPVCLLNAAYKIFCHDSP